MPRPANKSSFLGNLGVFIGVLVIMFGIAELVVRALYQDTTVMFPRYHTDAVYGDYTLRTVRPNSNYFHTSADGRWEFTTNSQGFRNYRDFSYAKDDGVIRVIAIGDSHTQGFEVHQDYTYSATIEKYLRQRGFDVEVINTGVSGFSNAEALLLLENELVKYDPDYIVLGFYGNDFKDNLKAGFFALDGAQELVRTAKRRHVPGVAIQNFIYAIPGIQWLSENSYFYSLLFNKVWVYAKRLLAGKSSRARVDKPAIEKTQAVVPDEEVAVNTSETHSDYQQVLAAKLIDEIYRTSKDAGARFILLDIPSIRLSGQEFPSISQEFERLVEGRSDYFQSSRLLMPYRGMKVIHQPNGLKHITRFSHTLLGTGIARYIESDLRSRETGTAAAIE